MFCSFHLNQQWRGMATCTPTRTHAHVHMHVCAREHTHALMRKTSRNRKPEHTQWWEGVYGTINAKSACPTAIHQQRHQTFKISHKHSIHRNESRQPFQNVEKIPTCLIMYEAPFPELIWFGCYFLFCSVLLPVGVIGRLGKKIMME